MRPAVLNVSKTIVFCFTVGDYHASRGHLGFRICMALNLCSGWRVACLTEGTLWKKLSSVLMVVETALFHHSSHRTSLALEHRLCGHRVSPLWRGREAGIYFLRRSSRGSPRAASSGSPSEASRSGGSAARAPACGAAESGSHKSPASAMNKGSKTHFKIGLAGLRSHKFAMKGS